jgi:hypothetical protein
MKEMHQKGTKMATGNPIAKRGSIEGTSGRDHGMVGAGEDRDGHELEVELSRVEVRTIYDMAMNDCRTLSAHHPVLLIILCSHPSSWR